MGKKDVVDLGAKSYKKFDLIRSEL